MLPVVPVGGRTEDRGVLFRVVAVHDGTPSAVSALARVDVAVPHAVLAAAVPLVGFAGVLAGVEVLVDVDGGDVVADVAVVVHCRLPF